MKTAPHFRPLQLLLVLALSLTALVGRAAHPRPDDPVTGIKFFTGSWSAVLAEAKKQNKPVFVDIYTTWCGPCKLMAKQAFPDKAVGDLFNTNFVSYQIDAEKGEGIDVAKKYAVTAYPTSLYVSANGDLIHRAIGYGGIKGLLDEANKAVMAAKDPKPIALWDKEFAEGKRDAEFLRTYLTKRAKLGMPNAEALEAYLKAAPEAELTTPESVEAMSGNLTTANSKAYDLLLDAAKTSPKNRMVVMQSVSQAMQRDERKAKTEADMQAVINNRLKMNDKLSMKMPGSTQTDMTDGMWLSFYQRTKNVPKYREYASKSGSALLSLSTDSLKAKNEASYQRFMTEAKSVPDSVKKSENFVKYANMMKTIETQQVAMKLNSLAWGYFENMTEPTDLNQALTWSSRSLELERSAASIDTYAQLLGKLGRKPEAIKYEEEALAKAKAMGEDTSDYEKTLAALKQ